MSSVSQYMALPQGAGYGVVVGLGAVFAGGMVLTTFILRRYNKEIMTAEEFATAGRSVKTGLISAAVVSSWTWAATLLTSTTQVYNNGISGAFFYAAGATCQIILFACLAIKGKERAPAAHSYLEIIRARYGRTTHTIYIFWGLATNILVTAMLLTGGSAVFTDSTGMNTVAACLLLPLGVVVYTLFGGIKATFLTDYAHTIAIIVIIFVFAFNSFAISDKLGSIDKVWEIITKLAETQPREGNAGGSYLTMHSRSGGIFFVINIVGNFGTVFLDNGYFNKAFAADPASAMPGYVLGGLAWFAIPCFCATTLGLTALALERTPYWPTYPNLMTKAEVTAGLVLPNAAMALLGKGGAMCALILAFMAVTSAMLAELIAVSTIFTYDIYRPYINPNASGKRLIWTSHAAVIFFAYAMAGFSIGLYYAGISMGYLYELMGIIIGGAVLPLALTLLSKKQNKIAATYTPPIATGLAIMSWLLCTRFKFGSISVDTTFEDDAMLTGNVVALCSPLLIVPILTYAFKPQNFDWNILKKIQLVNEDEEIAEATRGLEDTERDGHVIMPIKSQLSVVALTLVPRFEDKFIQESANLRKSFKTACAICVALTLCLVILWPMPMYGTKYIFSKTFFRGWIIVLFIWLFFTACMVIIYPLWEGREALATTFRGIYWDLSGQSHKLRAWQNEHPERLHVVMSQVNANLITSQSQDYDSDVHQYRGEKEPHIIDDEMDKLRTDSE